MINGFPEETKELNDFEKQIAKFMIPKLNLNVGVDKAVTNIEIRRKLKTEGYEVAPARVRKIIHFIRVHKLVINLISTSKGYYRATKQKDLDKYVEGLQQRINSIAEVKKSFLTQ